MKTNLNICGWIVCAVLLTFVATVLASTAFGYGNEGHQTVGAIADKLIANSPNTVAHVRALIGNETLEHASMWADDCKYNFNPHDHDMVAFVSANPHVQGSNGPHDHHAYHYTDIPIQETHYRAGSVGTKPIDVVHMLRNCIAIIEGHSNATNNPTGITQKTALRLLVHYVGDIHQPFHVGTAYFGTNAQLVNPNTTTGARADDGGNLIEFHGTKLHVTGTRPRCETPWLPPTCKRLALSRGQLSGILRRDGKRVPSSVAGLSNGPTKYLSKTTVPAYLSPFKPASDRMGEKDALKKIVSADSRAKCLHQLSRSISTV